VYWTRGGGLTVIVRLQLDVRCCASVAVHVTVVAPTGKVDPLAGVHVSVTGALPPMTVADAYTTGIGDASGEVNVCEAGHETLGGSAGGGVGVVGVLPPQPTAQTAATNRQAKGWMECRLIKPGSSPPWARRPEIVLEDAARAGPGGPTRYHRETVGAGSARLP
jgi:hypothetical protein